MERQAGTASAINQDAIAAITATAAPSVLRDAARLLQPVRRMLEANADSASNGPPPAGAFCPVTAAGDHPRHRYQPPRPRQPAGTALSHIPAGSPVEAELAWMTAADIAARVAGGYLSPGQVAAACGRRVEALDGHLGTFVTVTIDAAKAAAGQPAAPAGTMTGPGAGPLAGVPVGLKDIIDVAGVPTTCGSRTRAGHVAGHDAPCWTRMREAGAQLAGKLVTHEFAAGVTCEDTPFGTVRNPLDTRHMAGGSSGGPAAAVAAGLVTVALGTDTGGSIRIPAACCGVVGLKPTFGRVPTEGVQPLAWSLDHVGPIARTVRDAALVLDVIAGTSCEPAARSGAEHGAHGLRMGVPVEWLGGLQPAVRTAFEDALQDLRRAGAEITEVRGLPDPGSLALVNRVIAYAEGSACHDQLLRSAAPFGEPILPRLQAGRFLLAGEYLAAQRLRADACRSFARAWAAADVLVTPTLPCTAPLLGTATLRAGGQAEPLGTTLIRYTAPFNLAGLPALTVPSRTSGRLPAGLQLIAPPTEDHLACFAAAAYERARGDAGTPPRLPVSEPAV